MKYCAGKSWLLIPSLEQKESPVARGKKREEVSENLNPNWSCLFHSWQKGSSRSLKPTREARELRSKLKKRRKKKTGGIETDMSSIEVAQEEFSLLFLYSCILMSLCQVNIKNNSYGNFGFFKKVSSHSRINSSSSITTSKGLSRRKVLASLKVDIFVCERNIAVAVPSEIACS